MAVNIKTSNAKTSDAAPKLADLIWDVAELLRGPYKPAQYGSVILPFTVLRRLDCVLEPTKEAVLKAAVGIQDFDDLRLDEEMRLKKATKDYSFFNVSKFTMTTAVGDADNLRANLEDFVGGFSENVRDVFERYSINRKRRSRTVLRVKFPFTMIEGIRSSS